jgi:hypothetical protein
MGTGLAKAILSSDKKRTVCRVKSEAFAYDSCPLYERRFQDKGS